MWSSSNFTSNGWLCLLFGEMHKLSERNVYTDSLFFARSCKILTKKAFLASFKKHNSCKFFCKKWESVARLLQEFCKIYYQIHQSSKICIYYKNFAKVVLIARILQDFWKNCFSCEIRYLHIAYAMKMTKNEAKLLWNRQNNSKNFETRFSHCFRNRYPNCRKKLNVFQSTCMLCSFFLYSFIYFIFPWPLQIEFPVSCFPSLFFFQQKLF